MVYVLAVIAGIVAAVVGWFVTGALAAWIAGLFGMSDFEGARGMFAFLGVGPIGGLIAMVVAAGLVLRIGTGRGSLGQSVARLLIVLGAIATVVIAAIWLRLTTLDTYTDALPPRLEFEIRVPAGMRPPTGSQLRVELHTDKNVGEGLLAGDWVNDAGGHDVMVGSVELSFKTSSRLLVVSLPDQPTRLYRLPLSRDPDATATPSAWRHPDHVHVDGEEQPRAAPAGDPVEMRYRIQR